MALVQPNTPVFYLDSMISILATGIYTVTRPVASTYVNGVEVPDPSPTMFQVQAVINPVTGIKLRRLPEARRSTDYREVFTSVALNTNSDANSADLIQIGADTFEVEESDPYQLMGNVWISTVQRAGRLNAAAPTG